MLSILFPLKIFIFPKFIFFHFLFPYGRFSSSSFPLFSSSFPLYFFQSAASCLPYPYLISHFPNSWPVILLVKFIPEFIPRNYYQYKIYSVCLSFWLFPCFLFQIFLRTRVVFSQFGATYFTHVMHTNCRIPNFLFLVCFSASPFSVSIVPFHCLRIFVPSLISRHYLQNVVFPEFSFNSRVFFSFHLSPRLFSASLPGFVFRRPAPTYFSCCLSSWP